MSKKKKEKKVITSCKCQQLRVMIMTHFNILCIINIKESVLK